jgi:thiol-disulfide isomerase/thioredoxin
MALRISLILLILVSKVLGDVVDVNVTNYFDFVSGDSYLLEFYSPWCPNCVRFEKSYEHIAKQLQSLDKTFKIGRIDTSSSPALASLYAVDGLPEFYLYKDQKLYKLRDGLTVQAMIEYCREGYVYDQALTSLSSVLGPLGRLKSAILWIGVLLTKSLEYLTNTLSLSYWQAILITVILATIGLVIITIVAVALSVKYLKLD